MDVNDLKGLFGEVNNRQKFLAVLGVLAGIVLTILG